MFCGNEDDESEGGGDQRRFGVMGVNHSGLT